MNTPLTSLPDAEQTGTFSERVGVQALKPGVRKLTFHFRWPVVVLPTGNDGSTVECLIPCGNGGAPVIAHQFAEHFMLTDAELDKAEAAVLRQVAILPES